MNVLQFQHPQYFYLFLIIPLIVGLYLLKRMVRKKAIQNLGAPELVEKLMPIASKSRPWVKFVLICLAFSAIIIGIVNPMIGSQMENVKKQGVDMMLVLDVSNSMMAQDIKPNRLDRSKMAISNMINKLDDDRVGLIVFAGTAFTQLPLTPDHSAAKMFVNQVNTNTIAQQGTAIGEALQRAVASFPPTEGKNKVIILISDGENHEDDPITVAQEASQNGITIHTIGMGTQAGAPIPVYEGAHMKNYMRDENGNTVISRFDESLMQKIAAAGNGRFVRASGSDAGLNQIMKEIRKMQDEEYESVSFSHYESKFFIFAAIALFLLVFELIITERKSKWTSKINIFKVR